MCYHGLSVTNPQQTCIWSPSQASEVHSQAKITSDTNNTIEIVRCLRSLLSPFSPSVISLKKRPAEHYSALGPAGRPPPRGNVLTTTNLCRRRRASRVRRPGAKVSHSRLSGGALGTVAGQPHARPLRRSRTALARQPDPAASRLARQPDPATSRLARKPDTSASGGDCAYSAQQPDPGAAGGEDGGVSRLQDAGTSARLRR